MKRFIIAGVAATTLAGGAYAFATVTPWATPGNGAGSGQAVAGSALDVNVVAGTGTITNDLFPGNNGDLQVTFDNPNPFPVLVTGWTWADITAVTCPGSKAAALSWVSAGGPASTSQSFAVPAKGASGDGQLVHVFPNAVHMGASDTACQGQTLNEGLSSITANADNASIS